MRSEQWIGNSKTVNNVWTTRQLSLAVVAFTIKTTRLSKKSVQLSTAPYLNTNGYHWNFRWPVYGKQVWSSHFNSIWYKTVRHVATILLETVRTIEISDRYHESTGVDTLKVKVGFVGQSSIAMFICIRLWHCANVYCQSTQVALFTWRWIRLEFLHISFLETSALNFLDHMRLIF